MFHNFFSKLNKTEAETMAVINETYLFGSSACQESFVKLKEWFENKSRVKVFENDDVEALFDDATIAHVSLGKSWICTTL